MNNKKRKVIKLFLFVIIPIVLIGSIIYFGQMASNYRFMEDLGVFKNRAAELLSQYNAGDFGEEVFYLTSTGHQEIAVCCDGDKSFLLYISTFDGGVHELRELSDAEYSQFIEFIRNNDIDSLRDFRINNPVIWDGTEYLYLHISSGGKKGIRIFYPDIFRLGMDGYKNLSIPEEEVHRSLIHADLLDQFFDLAETSYQSGRSGKNDADPLDDNSAQSAEINLKEIQVGNYSSLQGTWTEVAYAVNYYDYDNPGVHWKEGASPYSPTLSISSDKIVYNDEMVMQGNTITDNAGSHPLLFENRGSSLVALVPDTHYVAINWGVFFYQKEATNLKNDFQPDNGVQIDNTKNLIIIWTSNMGYTAVFAKTDH